MHKTSIVAAILAMSVGPSSAQDVSLFAAGSLKSALSDVVEDFTEATGKPVTAIRPLRPDARTDRGG